MTWGSPHLLPWLALALPFAVLLAALLRRRLRRFTRLVVPARWPGMIPGWSPRAAWRPFALWTAALLLLTLALARPQWGFTWREVKRTGLDIVVAVDTSRSMLATDLKPNRLAQAKWGIRDLLQLARGDRIGLVVFAGVSYLQSPLTVDYGAVAMYVDDLNPGLVPRGGSAITEALRTAIDAFDESDDADRVILLITDGEDTQGNPLDLLPELTERGIKVYTIGVGSPEGELIPVTDEQGRETFLRDRSGNVVKSSLNEDILTRLALGTGGAYLRAAPGQLGIERLIADEWSKLKPSEGEVSRIKVYEDRAGWFIGLALLLLAAEAATGRPWRRRENPA